MSLNLFGGADAIRYNDFIGPESVILRGAALSRDTLIITAIKEIEESAPFRHMITPGGHRMSVAMTNCGGLGWVTDLNGYRYTEIDPKSNQCWPRLPEVFQELASESAAAAGFRDFVPDACLINRYEPGSRLTLHQDKNEKDFSAPIVSVSLGVPAVFQFGGLQRNDKVATWLLLHGDVAVWGGEDRMRYHGILPVKHGYHDSFGEYRINLTFRKAR